MDEDHSLRYSSSPPAAQCSWLSFPAWVDNGTTVFFFILLAISLSFCSGICHTTTRSEPRENGPGNVPLGQYRKALQAPDSKKQFKKPAIDSHGLCLRCFLSDFSFLEFIYRASARCYAMNMHNTDSAFLSVVQCLNRVNLCTEAQDNRY